MSEGLTALLFLASFVLTVVSSLVLAEVVDRVGERFGFSEGLLGIVTALAADSPEIAAAVTAIERGRTGVGLGVIVGSNIFNIAALLGLSAVVAGKVRIRRRALVFQGGVVLFVTVVASALVLEWVAPIVALVAVLQCLSPTLASLPYDQDRSSGLFAQVGPKRFSSLLFPAWRRTCAQGGRLPASLATTYTPSCPL